MKTHIINIGDELTSGRIANSNAQVISRELFKLGMNIEMIITIPDDNQTVINQLAYSTSNADLVIITGGLGPTEDDRTLQALAEFYEVELEFHPEVFARIQDIFAQREKVASPANRKQAMIPKNFEILSPYLGTAPGLCLHHEHYSMYVFPGVPREMSFLLKTHLLPWIQRNYVCSSMLQKTYRTINLPESELAQKVDNLEEIEKFAKISFLPHFPVNDVVLTVSGENTPAAEKKLQLAEKLLWKKIGPWVYGEGDQTLGEVVGKLLLKHKLTLGIAESCTGGLIADRLTNVEGSSNYFRGGIVAYSIQAKQNMLGIDEDIIEQQGAVSPAIAQLMAEKARLKFRADIGLSTTGLVSLYEHNPKKGLVFCGISTVSFKNTVREVSLGDRKKNKLRFSQVALGMLLEFLKNNI
ncbi:MAG: hypothetical protein APR63_10115 [Desulfuromonas sp. SDB]|nr:MAG: hypothetical protein APR63_10115 [Desulfuromonas sp. SDB]